MSDFLHDFDYNSNSSSNSGRKSKYLRKLLGELEAYTYHPMDEWEDDQFDEVWDMLHALGNAVQAHNDRQDELKANAKGLMQKCLLCGKITLGSIGKAGIKWSCICQECKDKEDEALSKRMDTTARSLKKLINGIDAFSEWLGGEVE